MPHLACCVLAFSLACGASAAAASLTDWQDGAQAGVFLMRPAADAPLTPATLLRTDVDVRVSGPVAHVTVRQSFFNQGGAFAEAWYVFPLPETSAVHAMELVVGQRRIVGR